MGDHVDASGIFALAGDFGRAPGRLERHAPGLMEREAFEVKQRMREIFSGHRYAGQVPGSLEYERTDFLGLGYEIGELDSGGPQWGLAAILAFGTSNNAPVVDHTDALRRQAPKLEEKLGDEAEDAVLGGAE